MKPKEILNKIKKQEEEIADDTWLDNHRLIAIKETKKEILNKIKKMIDEELIIWKEAHPEQSKLLEDFAVKIKCEVNLLK